MIKPLPNKTFNCNLNKRNEDSTHDFIKDYIYNKNEYQDQEV